MEIFFEWVRWVIIILKRWGDSHNNFATRLEVACHCMVSGGVQFDDRRDRLPGMTITFPLLYA